MPPDMKYLDKLRLSRIMLADYIDRAIDFDKDCLQVALEVVEEAIQRLEFIEKIKGGRKE